MWCWLMCDKISRAQQVFGEWLQPPIPHNNTQPQEKDPKQQSRERECKKVGVKMNDDNGWNLCQMWFTEEKSNSLSGWEQGNWSLLEVLLHQADSQRSTHTWIPWDKWLTPGAPGQSTPHSTLCPLTPCMSLLLHLAKERDFTPSLNFRDPVVTGKLEISNRVMP